MGKIFLYNELYKLKLELDQWINRNKQLSIGITGMFANPIHSGHIKLLAESYELSNVLIVALNNDDAAVRKHGYSFMDFGNRASIISSLLYVDYVIENPFDTMVELLDKLPVNLYLKGGDVTLDNLLTAEKEVCTRKNIKILDNIGGTKVASSRDFLYNYIQWFEQNITGKV